MPDFPPELLQVVTVGEASHMWGISNKSLIQAIYRDRVIGRKSRGTWLVTLSSMVNTYGKPKNHMIDWEVK